MCIIILDTETSGLTGSDRIIELGIIILDENMKEIYSGSEFCKIPFELSTDVSEYTGIYERDLIGANKIKETSVFLKFQEYNTQENIVVIHNAWFDLYMLYLSHIKVECQVIDTLTCARHVYINLESYSLVSLINNIVQCVDDKEFVQAHRAIGDCEVLLKLFNHLLMNNTKLDLLFMSQRHIIGFGKHKGKLWTQVDKGYLKWVHNNFAATNSPTQMYVKVLLNMEMCPKQRKMAEYLKLM